MPWAIAAGATAAAVVLGAMRFTAAPAPVATTAPAPAALPLRLELQTPAAFRSQNRVEMIVSPDGRWLVMFSVGLLDMAPLVVRDLQSGATRELPDIIGAFDPTWSPDSRHLAYNTAAGQIARIALDSGNEQILCACAVRREPHSLAWVGDWIVFRPDSVGA